MTMLAVFRSRAQALDCTALLKRAGIGAQAVPTPKEAGFGCGISVRFDARHAHRVRLLIAGKRYSSFAGCLKEGAGGYAHC